jgi:hypothetical protein
MGSAFGAARGGSAWRFGARRFDAELRRGVRRGARRFGVAVRRAGGSARGRFDAAVRRGPPARRSVEPLASVRNNARAARLVRG